MGSIGDMTSGAKLRLASFLVICLAGMSRYRMAQLQRIS